MSGFSSSSSSSSVFSDREAKKLQKVLERDAKADEKHLDRALKNVKKAEKALDMNTKAAERAQRLVVKAKEKEHAAAKALNKANHKLANALEDEKKAQQALAIKEAREAETERSIRQVHHDLDDCQHTIKANAKDREMRLAEVHAQHAQGNAHNSQPEAPVADT